jgi:thiamine-phosphate pyrophosphorylase
VTIPRIYAIADAEALGSIPLPEAVAAMVDAGIGWIQVRAKRLAGRDLFQVLDACCRRLEGTGAALWIDDRADLAALFPVAGIHVGQTDLPPMAVRRIVGTDVRIGLSTHDEAQLAAADADPDVDVVAVGPVFPTASKERPDPVIGLDFVRRARARTAKPLVAIGGIGAESVRAVLEAGADAAVVLGAVCRAGDLAQIGRNARHLLASTE